MALKTHFGYGCIKWVSTSFCEGINLNQALNLFKETNIIMSFPHFTFYILLLVLSSYNLRNHSIYPNHARPCKALSNWETWLDLCRRTFVKYSFHAQRSWDFHSAIRLLEELFAWDLTRKINFSRNTFNSASLTWE